MKEVKVLAFHLPQFHTIPENDEWWGEGFTEWRSVRAGKPYFKNHNQPRIPVDNNYYNLLEEKSLKWQMQLAKEYGVHGFCFYHYWFNGKLLLEKPVEKILEMEEKIPFCFCWPNEAWKRTWYGMKPEILIEQRYGGEEEWQAHLDYLMPFFKDDAYIKVDGKPLFVIYRANIFPYCDEMIQYWDARCKENGFDGIHVVEERNYFQDKPCCKYSEAVVEFEPNYTMQYHIPTAVKVVKKATRILLSKVRKHELNTFSYDRLWKKILNRKREEIPGKKQYLGAFVDWDNSPRKGGNGAVVLGATPEAFEKYFEKQCMNAKKIGSEYVFINAWNEWSEGTYLEPDKANGYGYLEAIKKVLSRVNR